MNSRHYTKLDQLLIGIDSGLRTLFADTQQNGSRNSPVAHTDEPQITAQGKRQAASLMRVNHCGEVCAQALYQGQALTANDEQIRDSLKQAAAEENDHLNWCSARIKELDGRTSVLNPFFYLSSFAIGAAAGKLGDRWSLGFLAETERQVVHHLDKHIKHLPEQDHKSRIILETMKQDEAQHATNAIAAGGRELPLPVRLLMQASSKIMTKTTYWL